jgi:hypothetical protein
MIRSHPGLAGLVRRRRSIFRGPPGDFVIRACDTVAPDESAGRLLVDGQ